MVRCYFILNQYRCIRWHRRATVDRIHCNYCSIVGKRPKTAAEPYTKWREPLRRRVHQCVVGLFKWKVLWKEPAWPWPRGFGTCVRWDEKRQRDAKGRVGWDASENECKRSAVWVEKRERASADAEDESCRVASVVERSSC